jgi:rubredoxin
MLWASTQAGRTIFKRKEMEINFECKSCGGIFDNDVGTVSVSMESFRPQFENETNCPKCGRRSIDDVLLTELGQSQLTEATLDFEAEDLNGFGFYEGECQGCDTFQPLNDLALCEKCAVKLDRDLIRQRDWDYSVSAFGVPESKLEDLRKEVIKQYGEKLELIALTNRNQKKSKKRKRNKKRSGKRR